MNKPFLASAHLNLSEVGPYEYYEGLISEADSFRNRHQGTDPFDARVLSDAVMLCLRFNRNSEVASALTKQAYGVTSAETAFWFLSQITANVDVIHEACREVDRLLALVYANADLAEEALGWAEDFSMAQPDAERIELKFGP